MCTRQAPSALKKHQALLVHPTVHQVRSAAVRQALPAHRTVRAHFKLWTSEVYYSSSSSWKRYNIDYIIFNMDEGDDDDDDDDDDDNIVDVMYD